jgi:uncharacterized membrane protein YoaK (UPF0700 family)
MGFISTTTIVTSIIGIVIFITMIIGYHSESKFPSSDWKSCAQSIAIWGLVSGAIITFLLFLFFKAPIILGIIIAGVIWFWFLGYKEELKEEDAKDAAKLNAEKDKDLE